MHPCNPTRNQTRDGFPHTPRSRFRYLTLRTNSKRQSLPRSESRHPSSTASPGHEPHRVPLGIRMGRTWTSSTFSSTCLAALLAATISFILATLAAFSSGVRAFAASELSLKSLWPACEVEYSKRGSKGDSENENHDAMP